MNIAPVTFLILIFRVSIRACVRACARSACGRDSGYRCIFFPTRIRCIPPGIIQDINTGFLQIIIRIYSGRLNESVVYSKIKLHITHFSLLAFLLVQIVRISRKTKLHITLSLDTRPSNINIQVSRLSYLTEKPQSDESEFQGCSWNSRAAGKLYQSTYLLHREEIVETRGEKPSKSHNRHENWSVEWK